MQKQQNNLSEQQSTRLILIRSHQFLQGNNNKFTEATSVSSQIISNPSQEIKCLKFPKLEFLNREHFIGMYFTNLHHFTSCCLLLAFWCETLGHVSMAVFSWISKWLWQYLYIKQEICACHFSLLLARSWGEFALVSGLWHAVEPNSNTVLSLFFLPKYTENGRFPYSHPFIWSYWHVLTISFSELGHVYEWICWLDYPRHS